MRLSPGSRVPARDLTAVGGSPVPVPDPARLVHLQLRRFAGCPVCNLHLRTFARRHAEIEAADVREVAVFHSPVAELAPHVDGLPFPVIADPDKRLYAEFGVEAAPRALLDPRAWGPILRSVAHGVFQFAAGRGRLPARSPAGGRLGLPGDFLIGPDGRVVAAKYGEHASDQWSVDEMLALAAKARTVERGHRR